MSIRISNSAMDLYNTCARKYKFRYLDRYAPNKTYTALLFGGAIDKSLNYILLSVKKKRPFKIQVAKWLFCRAMDSWYGQNELVFYKNEIPPDMVDCDDLLAIQWSIFYNLIDVGQSIIDTYVSEILPQFDEILDVQCRKEVVNAEGDVLVLILDFIARLKDGRVVLFDNKTSSNPKRDYPKTAVKKSQQLALYVEQFQVPYAGYIVLAKKPGFDKWKMIVDEVLEEKKEEIYDTIVATVDNIKAGKFEKNEKACFSFGRICEFASACKYNNYSGLLKR